MEFLISLCQEALKVTLFLSAPMLGFGLLAGLIVSIFQATTQIQDMTLTFVPKILAVILALILFSVWMLNVLLHFTSNLFIHIPDYINQ